MLNIKHKSFTFLELQGEMMKGCFQNSGHRHISILFNFITVTDIKSIREHELGFLEFLVSLNCDLKSHLSLYLSLGPWTLVSCFANLMKWLFPDLLSASLMNHVLQIPTEAESSPREISFMRDKVNVKVPLFSQSCFFFDISITQAFVDLGFHSLNLLVLDHLTSTLLIPTF